MKMAGYKELKCVARQTEIGVEREKNQNEYKVTGGKIKTLITKI